MMVTSDGERPRILFITSHWPLAAAYGAQQRVMNIARLLGHFGDVSFVIVSTDPEDEAAACETKREFQVHRVVRPVLSSSATPFHGLFQRLRHEFDPRFMLTDLYEVSEAERQGLEELIHQHDLVWVHTITPANWLRIYRWPRSVLDVDNLHSRTLLSEAQSGGSLGERLLNLRRGWIWKQRERRFQERFTLLTTCSEEDRQYLGAPKRTYVIPNGCCPIPLRPRIPVEPPRLGFIGNCAFMPNEEGLKWFIRGAWPRIKREFPRAELRLVGYRSDGYLKGLGPDIVGLGWLEDPSEEIATWSSMIVPINVGGGTRVKLAEGLARRCPVVSTRTGAFGYHLRDGVEVLLADRPADFASACIKLLRSPELAESLSQEAHKCFLERYTWDSFETTVGAVVRECIAKADSASPNKNVTRAVKSFASDLPKL